MKFNIHNIAYLQVAFSKDILKINKMSIFFSFVNTDNLDAVSFPTDMAIFYGYKEQIRNTNSFNIIYAMITKHLKQGTDWEVYTTYITYGYHTIYT